MSPEQGGAEFQSGGLQLRNGQWLIMELRKLYETVAYFLGRILESLIFAAVKSLIRKDLEQESSMSYSLCRTWQLAGQLTGRAF